MTPSLLAAIADAVDNPPKVEQRESFFERMLTRFFPVRVQDLGKVGINSYHNRTSNFDPRPSRATTRKSELKYKPGTRGSRMHQMGLLSVLVLSVVSTCSAQVQYPQTAKTGKVSLTVPGDSARGLDNTNSPLKRTQTTHYVSRSLEATIHVTSIEYKDLGAARPRLTEYLEQFIASYGSVDHLASIKEDGRKGMSIQTEIYHDRSMMRFTYVDTRVFVDDTHLYAVTVETEVTPQKPIRQNELTEILVSMKVN